MSLSRVFAAAISCFLLPAFAAEAKQDVFVSLHSSAVVEGRTVRLGDLAEVTARDPIDQAKYQAIEVVRPISMATPLRLTREDVVRHLASTSPEVPGRIIWGGSNSVVVTGKSQRVSLENGINSAAAFLMEKLGGSDYVTLRLLEVPAAIEAPVGKVHSRPDTQSVKKNGSYVEIPLVVEVDGVQVATPMLRFAVSRSPRQTGSVATPSIQAASVESGQEVGAGAIDPGPYLVARQQPVTILIDVDGMRVESEGIALENARQGESVRVRRASSNVELAGRAIRRGVVLLEEN